MKTRFIIAALVVALAAPAAALAAHIVGTDNGESLVGTSDPDYIEAKAGNDKVWGMQGGDLIEGDNGIDFLYGWQGADEIYGNGNDDRLYAGCDGVSCDAGTGNRLYGGLGDDHLGADNGRCDDHLNGGDGRDTAHKDACDTSTGNEVVYIDGVKVKG